MSKKRKGSVYMAGPIRSVGEAAFEWRDYAAGYLTGAGYICFNPAAAFHRPERISRRDKAEMEAINRRAIDACDVVLAVLSEQSQNIGTIRELEYGSSRGKRCMLVCEWEDVSHKVSAFDLETFTDLDDALYAIAKKEIEEPGVPRILDVDNFIRALRGFTSAVWMPPMEQATVDAEGRVHAMVHSTPDDGRLVKARFLMPEGEWPESVNYRVEFSDMRLTPPEPGVYSVDTHDNDDGE